MSDIVVKKNGGASAERAPLRAMRDVLRWDPLREILRWDPFREMAPMLSQALEGVEWNPGFDVTETKDAFLFKADVPGVKKEDLEITTTGNRIQIVGKRQSEEEKKSDIVYTYERQYGDFTRSFTLPAGADIEHAKSELKDGVLTVVVPKLAESQSKKIQIATGAKS